MKDFIPYISIAVALISTLIAIDNRRYARSKDTSSEQQKEWAALNSKLDPALLEVGKLRMQMDVLWQGMQFSVKALHSPHTPELDALLEKFDHGSLDDEEVSWMRTLLIQIRDDKSEEIARQTQANNVLLLIQYRYGQGVTAS